MKRLTHRIIFIALLPAACAVGPVTVAPPAPAAAHVMYDPPQLRWGAAPDALPAGAQVAVLEGDPSTPEPFVLRLKVPAGYRIATHWHPTNEHVTVIEGDFSLRMDEGSEEHSHTFGPGGYVLLPARMHHSASTQNGAVVQIQGLGPFVLNYVNPADDPRR